MVSGIGQLLMGIVAMMPLAAGSGNNQCHDDENSKARTAICGLFRDELEDSLESDGEESSAKTFDVVSKYWPILQPFDGDKNVFKRDVDDGERFVFGLDCELVRELVERLDLWSITIVIDDSDIRSIRSGQLVGLNFVRERGLKVSLVPMRESHIDSLVSSRLRREGSAIIVTHSDNTKEFVNNCSSHEAFVGVKSFTPWFVFSEDGNSWDFSKLMLDINTELYSCEYDPNGDVEIRELYRRHSQENETTVRTWGAWDFSQKNLLTTDRHKWSRRKDLTGLHIRAATIESPPYTYLTNLTGGRVSIRGFHADVWHELRRLTNFSYAAVRSRDGTWGRRLADGSYNGMVGMLVDGEVDFLVTDFYATADRALVADFSVSIAYDKSMMLVLRDPQRELPWHAFLDPFTRPLWTTAVVAALVSGAVFVAVHAIADAKLPKSDSEKHDFTYADTLFMVVFAFSQQGTRHVPRRASTRVVFFTIYLTFLLLYEAFEAALFSTLTVKRATPATLRSIYENTNYKIGTVQGTATEFLLENGNALHQLVYSERYSPVSDMSEGLSRVFDPADDFGFIFGDVTLGVLLGDDVRCQVELADVEYPRGKFVFVMQKGFEYRELFDYYLLKLRKSGMLDRLDRLWKRNRAVPDCGGEGEKVVLSMRHLWTAFVFLMAAVAASFALFAAETVHAAVMACYQWTSQRIRMAQVNWEMKELMRRRSSI